MAHTHQFDIRDEGTDRDHDLRMVVEGAVNGTRYSVDIMASGPGCDDGPFGPSVREDAKGLAKDLRRELEPLRPELTDADYIEFSRDILDEAKTYADDYYREAGIRYTPN